MPEALPEIRILSEEVANRIAAGEVIERPASAIKELVENALDAKATQIDIEFKNGGKSFIKVSDNGHGMRKDQALTALEAHATSKIRSADDLDKVLSFGFRGEALPSIASIAKFKLSTKAAASQVGTCIEVYAGKVKAVGECAMSTGTEITVEDLFCGVPARRKFLKSDNTEADHIIKICRLYALARPDVAFRLAENSRLVFKSAQSDSLTERIEKIFGNEVAGKLTDLKPSENYGVSLSGCISKPGENWASTRNIYSFINGRPVDSKAVYFALKEAYKNAIPQGKYPAAFLFINIDTRMVDINVHPAKREVRLKNEFSVKNAILYAIAERLENFTLGQNSNSGTHATPSPKFEPKPIESERLKSIIDRAKNSPDIEVEDITPIADKSVAFAKKLAFSPLQFSAKKLQEEFADKKANSFNAETPLPPCGIKKDDPAQSGDILNSACANWKYLNHIGGKYVLFETQSSSLIILSVSAALKRIHYDRILKNLEGEKAKSQALLIPVNIEFEGADDEFFKKSIRIFEVCGFAIEEFGERFYRICAIPPWLEFGETENFIKNFVELAREEGVYIGRRNLSDKAFADLAVRRVRRSGIPENEYAAKSLLEDLFACKSPMFSPDGRRTCKEITAAEIRAFFGE